MLASVAAVEPLPLVPAINTLWKRRSGWPERAGQDAHVFKIKFAVCGQLVAQGEQLLNG